MTSWFHPGVIFFVAAALLPLVGLLPAGKSKEKKSSPVVQRIQQLILIAAPLIAITVTLNAIFGNTVPTGDYWRFDFIGIPITLGVVDKLSLMFSCVFTLMALIGAVYALHARNTAEHSAAFLYVGSALGVVFAGDYLSLFLFWELMAFSSSYLIFASGTTQSKAAGHRYLLVHIAGGLCLLAGILLHYHESGSMVFTIMDHTHGVGFYLIMTGFILNAAVPPLNAWLTDAYPEATITGAVFMCAFTTKTAIYVLLRGFPGTELLIWLGTIMAVYGVIYAVLENDCRRLLAYHIISQVGYMVAAVGIGSELAFNGAAAHAFAHILYKGLLFMGAGAVIYMTGKRKLTELGGLYKAMPITLCLYMIGALSISAFPFFSGFVSKSLVIAAAEQDHMAIVTLMLLLASSGTFLHTGLKLPYYMFYGKDSSLNDSVIKRQEPPLNMIIAMTLAAIACIAIGVFPQLLYQLLPYPVDFEPYTSVHITTTLSILIFTALGFAVFLRHLDPEDTISLDTDWYYRKGSAVFMWIAHHPLSRYEQWMSKASLGLLSVAQSLAKQGLRFDKGLIDATVNGIANLTRRSGQRLRQLQSGIINHYALAMVVGVVVVITFGAVVFDVYLQFFEWVR